MRGIAVSSGVLVLAVACREPVLADDQPGAIAASARVDQLIEWPHWAEWSEQQTFAKHSPEENLNRAIALIDSGQGDALELARSILERLIESDRSIVQAYIELARVAMKSNWGPEGRRHAEGLLTSALEIEPGNANAKILLGYVYTHRKSPAGFRIQGIDKIEHRPMPIW